MTFRRRLMTFVAFTSIVSPSLISCGQGQPAVCVQAEQLRQAVQQLQDTNLRETSLESLKATLRHVGTEFDEFRAEASNEFAPQVNAVKDSLAHLRSQVSTAVSVPSASAIGEVGTALGELQMSVENLWNDVSGTC